MIDTNAQGRSLRGDIVFVFALGLACYLAWQLRDVLVVLYVSALFAVVFAPVGAGRLEGTVGEMAALQGHRGAGIAPGDRGHPGGLWISGAAAGDSRPAGVFERSAVANAWPFSIAYGRFRLPIRFDPNDVIAHVQDVVSGAATQTLILDQKTGQSKLFSVVMGVILTVYFILEGDHAYRWFLSFFPPQNRERLDLTLQRAEVRMGKWLLGQGSLMLILGISSTIVYLILGVRYAYALGALAGMLNVIPIIGATVSIVLALLVAAIDSWGRVLGVAIFFAIYLQVENSLLVPRIMKSRVGLPGLAILRWPLLLGSSLAGVVGALVSVPTAVLVAELVDQYLVNKGSARADAIIAANVDRSVALFHRLDRRVDGELHHSAIGEETNQASGEELVGNRCGRPRRPLPVFDRCRTRQDGSEGGGTNRGRGVAASFISRLLVR